MTAPTALTGADLSEIDALLSGTDALLETSYPGDRPDRQPVHTVYVPADSCTPTLVRDWGDRALDATRHVGGPAGLAAMLLADDDLAAAVAPRVQAKLETEPVEDLRLDLEDGYGDRGDAAEDRDALAAAHHIATTVADGTAPPFVGIRFKSFEASTRARGLRTLDLVVSALVEEGGLPDGLVLTLPKVTTVDQVDAMIRVCERLETVHGLAAGRLRFEVQMETPQLILGADGTAPVARVLHRSPGRVSSLHYGTYDYSASLGISAQHQAMDHPAAEHAKQVMQVAVAGTGVHLSDGSTNIVPVGSPQEIETAWRLHARLVGRSLAAGFYQGWDLHPAQLATRFIATYAFYRSGFQAAAERLDRYVGRRPGGVMDEPATARALARFVSRGLSCGALDADEVSARCGLSVDALHGLASPRVPHSARGPGSQTT
ncbi:aldolase [Sanguibacter sp. 25GB23B1]|uniref:DUF6986 family protein n=1 Tax=unclassified Sanguibacter TaxID=2645534 RepID=UPI0032AF5485